MYKVKGVGGVRNMKKKFIILGVLILALAVLGVWAVPAFAAEGSGSGQTTQNTAQGKKIGIIARLMLVQDEAKVDAFLAKAEAAGKITHDQSVAIKQAWTDHHTQFKKGSVLVRLLQAKDVTKVQAFLDKAVSAKKITQEQADKVLALWHKLHDK
jgi:ribosomal 50S subunit-associated protein YjgA (DUF615 family)